MFPDSHGKQEQTDHKKETLLSFSLLPESQIYVQLSKHRTAIPSNEQMETGTRGQDILPHQIHLDTDWSSEPTACQITQWFANSREVPHSEASRQFARKQQVVAVANIQPTDIEYSNEEFRRRVQLVNSRLPTELLLAIEQHITQPEMHGLYIKLYELFSQKWQLEISPFEVRTHQ